MNFEHSRHWYLLYHMAIKSGGTKFNTEYIETQEKRKKINYDIRKLCISDLEKDSVTKVLKKVWYEWYFTDMAFKSPIINSVKKKIIKYVDSNSV